MSPEIANLNVLGLSTESLLIVLIVVILLQCFGILKCQEGMAPWDTFDARFQQERDGPIGATPSGDSEREKQYRNATRTEGLTGSDDIPVYDNIVEELPPKNEEDINKTENSLEHSLHGS